MIYQPPPVARTAEITISSASITLTLANNTLYTFSSSAITEINLSAAAGMKYINGQNTVTYFSGVLFNP